MDLIRCDEAEVIENSGSFVDVSGMREGDYVVSVDDVRAQSLLDAILEDRENEVMRGQNLIIK